MLAAQEPATTHTSQNAPALPEKARCGVCGQFISGQWQNPMGLGRSLHLSPGEWRWPNHLVLVRDRARRLAWLAHLRRLVHLDASPGFLMGIGSTSRQAYTVWW